MSARGGTFRDGDAAAVSLGHMPDGRWVFDEDVTRVFEDMLARSIPQYDTIRELVFQVGKHFARSDRVIVDLGASRGDAIAPFVGLFSDTASYVGVEVSPPMLRACRERFASEIASGCFSLLDLDLREGYPDVEAALTLSILTLQFVPIGYRAKILHNVYEHTDTGGACILVEKVLGSSETIDRLLTELYHGLKRANGYGEDAIERKRLSLEGVLVPVTGERNEDLLRRAGFEHVECFWRCLNFAGWVAVKNGGGSTPSA